MIFCRLETRLHADTDTRLRIAGEHVTRARAGRKKKNLSRPSTFATL